MRRRAFILLLAVILVPIAGAFMLRTHRDRRIRDLLPELTNALEAETQAFEKLEWPQPPAFGEAVPGTAWDHYRRAAALADEIYDSIYHDDGFHDAFMEYILWEDPPEPFPSAYRPYLAQYAPVLTALRIQVRKRARSSGDLRVHSGGLSAHDVTRSVDLSESPGCRIHLARPGREETSPGVHRRGDGADPRGGREAGIRRLTNSDYGVNRWLDAVSQGR